MNCKVCRVENRLIITLANIKAIPRPSYDKYVLTLIYNTEKFIEIITVRNPEIPYGSYKLLYTGNFKDINKNKVYSYAIRNNKYNYNLYISEPIKWNKIYELDQYGLTLNII